MLHVILDANPIVRHDWFLAGAPSKVLLQQAATAFTRVTVAEHTVREIVGAYRRELARISDDHEGLRRRGAALRVPLPELGIDLDAASSCYEETLRAALDKARVRVPAIPEDRLALLIDKAIARRRPFDCNGHGFRDALLWQIVLDQLRENPYARIALISNDRRAFYTGDELHADLRDELLAAGRDPKDVQLHESVEQFVRSGITKDPELHARVTELIETEAAQVMENIAWALAGVDLELEDAMGLARIERVAAAHNVIVTGVGWVADSQRELAFVEMDVEADVDLDIDAMRGSDEAPIWTSTSTTLGFTMSATFDPSVGELADFSASLLPAIEVSEIFV